VRKSNLCSSVAGCLVEVKHKRGKCANKSAARFARQWGLLEGFYVRIVMHVKFMYFV